MSESINNEKSVVSWRNMTPLQKFLYRYEVITGIYFLQGWEKILINGIIITVLGIVALGSLSSLFFAITGLSL